MTKDQTPDAVEVGTRFRNVVRALPMFAVAASVPMSQFTAAFNRLRVSKEPELRPKTDREGRSDD